MGVAVGVGLHLLLELLLLRLPVAPLLRVLLAHLGHLHLGRYREIWGDTGRYKEI